MRAVKRAFSDFFHKGDMVLLALCLAASGLGLVLIYSATRYMGSNRSVLVQAAGIGIGVVCYFALTLIDMESLTRRTWWALALLSVALILALIPFGVGQNTTGNRNWIPIPGLRVNFQPGEAVKVLYVVLLAYHCAKLREHGAINHPFGVFSLGAHALALAGLLAVCSYDYGTSLIYLLMFVVVAWCAGVKWWWFALGIAAVVGAGAALWDRLPSHIRDRVAVVFLRNDPLGAGWQQEGSVLAIGSGGLTGQGLLRGTQTQRGGIIAQHTDEIFAVCGEELGLVGCAVLMLLLFAIVLRCFWIGYKTGNSMTGLVAMGVGGMLLAQGAINIAMCLYVFPVVGVTLPFFSYGGTSIITLYMAVGLVSGVKARDLPSWLKTTGGV